MLLTSIVVPTIPVTDLDKAKRFYTETLGLTALWDNAWSVRLGCGGGTQISIFQSDRSTANHTLAHFEVNDIERVVRELQQHDVTFIDRSDGQTTTDGYIIEVGPVRGAWFQDPDGNILGLRQA